MVRHQPLGPESVAAERAASADPVAVVDSVDEELLGVRMLRQVRTGLDVERLLPSAAKRESDVRKRLAKMAERAGFYIFVAAQAHAVGAGRAPARRNAELMLVREIAIRVPDSQIRSTSKVCTPPEGRLRARGWRAESAAAVSLSPGTFGWAGYGRAGRRERPRAAGPPAALSVHARLRRIGFALLCRYPGLRANPDELADALKWAAARRRLDYNGRIVEAAGAAAWALWRRVVGRLERE